MKTNFEKWRDSLTPEKMARLLQDHSDWDCHLREHCPASESCPKICKCHDVFLRWANAEAKEEDNA